MAEIPSLLDHFDEILILLNCYYSVLVLVNEFAMLTVLAKTKAIVDISYDIKFDYHTSIEYSVVLVVSDKIACGHGTPLNDAP